MADPQRDMELSNLFGGTRFWLSLNVPQRTKFKKMIEDHGGHIVLQEKHANVMLVDHVKRNLPSGTYSYKYVENSVRNGKLENLEDHRAGASASRPVGASHIARRGTRCEYTLADDQILFDWLYPYEQDKDSPISGNNIYKNIAEKFPQHTFQSWRARYLKNLRGKNRPGGGEPRSHEEVLALSKVPSIATEPEPQLQLKPKPTAKPARIPAAAKQGQLLKAARVSSSGADDSKQHHETGGKRQSLSQAATAAQPLSEPNPQATQRPKTAPKSVLPKPQVAPTPKSMAGQNLQAEPKPQTVPKPAAPKPQAEPKSQAAPTKSQTSGRESQHQTTERSRESSSGSSNSKRPHLSPPGSPSRNRRESGSPTAKRTHIETTKATKTFTSAKSPERRNSPVDGQRLSSPKMPPPQVPPTKKKPQFATTADVLRFWMPPEHLADQLIDLDLSELVIPPPPPGAEQSPEPSSDSDVEMGESDQESYSDVDGWIDAMVKRGAEEAVVLDALQCTSMLPEYAEQVLKHYAEGKGMPKNMRGAWTAEDDENLEGTDSRVMEKLYQKHGEDLVKYRLEYLTMAREE